MSGNEATYLNGEVAALKAAQAKAQETVNRVTRALAILEQHPDTSGTEFGSVLFDGAVLPGRKGKAVREYQRGGKAAEIAKKYGVSGPTIYNWVRKSGVPLHG